MVSSYFHLSLPICLSWTDKNIGHIKFNAQIFEMTSVATGGNHLSVSHTNLLWKVSNFSKQLAHHWIIYICSSELSLMTASYASEFRLLVSPMSCIHLLVMSTYSCYKLDWFQFGYMYKNQFLLSSNTRFVRMSSRIHVLLGNSAMYSDQRQL